MDDSPWEDVPSQSERSSIHEDTSTITKAKDPPSASAPAATAPVASRTAASRKVQPRKVGAQPTKLEVVEDAFDPLGPLGAASDASELPAPADQAPPPPRKEITGRPARSQSSAAQSVSVSEDADGAASPSRARGPPPVQPHTSGSARQTPPSMSIEQAARPTFDINVGDPHKVGDLTSSHIVYQVRTKTTSKAYKQPEFAVSRRYRDFLWLYTSLHNNNPGVVVPPPPEKQAVGRFESDFVESRRQALERMLNKIAAHPILHHDADLKIFLESEAFNVDIKNKENREPDLGQNKGMFSSLGINVGGSSSKFVEHDDWFHDRKIYLDALENQLKALLKAIETVVIQRRSLAEAAGDFAVSLGQLAQVELSPTFTSPLHGLSEIQMRIKELHQRQAQQDMLTLGITVDEYIRLIGSIKQAFTQRQKAYHSWHAAESELNKRRNAHEKLLRQGRSQQDKLNEVGAGVSDAEKKAHQARLLFEDLGRLMRGELERFEREKVEDFKSGVETFLEGAVEAQKEVIEMWETFLLQMDADEDPQSPLYDRTQESHTSQLHGPSKTTSSSLDGQQASVTDGSTMAEHNNGDHDSLAGSTLAASETILERAHDQDS